MKTSARAVAAGLACAAMLAALATTALGSDFTIGDRAFKATSESLSFQVLERTVRCPITITGSFSSGTFEKVAESSVAAVERVSLGTCTGGTVRIVAEGLPWTVRYASFAGTLPAITSATFHLTGAALQITPTGSPTCTARSTERAPLVATFQRETTHGIVSAVRFAESASIPTTGEGACSSGSARVIGSTNLTASDGLTEILLLIANEFEVTGVSETETESSDPVNDLVITAPALVGARAIENRMWNYQVRVTQILKVGGNPETFTIKAEAAEDCRAGKVLLPRNANACNIRVEHALTPRPQETNVKITYEWGIFLITFGSVEFHVRAT